MIVTRSLPLPVLFSQRQSSRRRSFHSSALGPIAPVSFAGHANCRGFQPGEHTVTCRLGHTTFRSCTPDQNLPWCTGPEECPGNLAAVSTSERVLPRRCRDSGHQLDNATGKAFLQQCCPETS